MNRVHNYQKKASVLVTKRVNVDKQQEKPWHWITRNKFYQTTPINGLNFIHASYLRCEFLFWYILLAIFTFFAIRDSYALIHQFISEDTQTSMKMVFSKDFDIPNVAVCVTITLPDFNQVRLDDESVEPYPVKYDSMEALNGSMVKFDDKQKFLHFKWDYLFIPLVNRYFSFLCHTEWYSGILNKTLLNYMEHPPDSDDSHFLFSEMLRSDEAKDFANFPVKYPIYPAGNVTRLFIDFVHSLNVSDTELLQKFSYELVRLFGLDVLKNRHQSGYQMIRPLSFALTWLDGREFCFTANMTGQTALKAQMGETVMFLADFTALKALFRRHTTYEHVPGFSTNEIGFGPVTLENVLNASSMQFYVTTELWDSVAADVESEMHYVKVASLELTGMYYALKSCSLKENGYGQCKIGCRAEIIEKSCGCTPLFMQYEIHTHSIRTCSMDDYLKCLKYDVEEVYNCHKNCLPNCQQFTYELHSKKVKKSHSISHMEDYRWQMWEKSSYNCNDNYKYSQFVLVITCWSCFGVLNDEGVSDIDIGVELDFPISKYPVFKEELTESWQNFLGDFGGILELWLGASLISLIHFVFFLAKQLLYACNKDTKVGRNIRTLLEAFPSLPFVPYNVPNSVNEQSEDYV